MLKYVLVLPALVLAALGAEGLYNANPESQADFIIAGLELAGAVLLIGLAVVLGRRSEPESEILPDSADRAEVIERLQRHTASLRMAEEREHAAKHRPGPIQPIGGPVSQPSVIRLPAIMLLNVADSAGTADIESAPPLGSKADVLARLREILPDLDLDAGGRSHHTGPAHSVRLDLGTGDVVHTIVIEAGGETGISLVRWLLETTGWRAFVPKSGRFVDAGGLDDIAIRND